MNAIKQILRKRQLASAAKSSNKTMMSDSALLDVRTLEMDQQVQALKDYLHERDKV